MEDCVKKVTGVSSSSEKLEIGDKVRIINNIPSGMYGSADDNYYWGGDTEEVPHGETGTVVRLHSSDKVLLQLTDDDRWYTRWYTHPDELEKIT